MDSWRDEDDGDAWWSWFGCGRPEARRKRKEKHKKKERKNFHAKREEEWASCKANVNWQIADLVPEIFTTLIFFFKKQ